MKKLSSSVVILSTLLLQFYSPESSAQFSVQGGIGYNFGVPGDLLGQNSINNNLTAVYGSYGSGLNLNAQVTDNLSCCPMLEWGLGADLQLGNKHTFKESSSGGITSFTVADAGKINVLSFTPRIGIHANCGSKFTVYGYYGPVIGIPLSFNEIITTSNTFGGTSDVSEQDIKTTGKLSIGITGAIGARLPLSKKVGAYLEAGYNYMNFYPNVKTITAYTIDGVNQLGTLNRRQLETDYVKSISSAYLSSNSPDQPTQVLREPLSYSGFRINAGIRYGF